MVSCGFYQYSSLSDYRQICSKNEVDLNDLNKSNIVLKLHRVHEVFLVFKKLDYLFQVVHPTFNITSFWDDLFLFVVLNIC